MGMDPQLRIVCGIDGSVTGVRQYGLIFRHGTVIFPEMVKSVRLSLLMGVLIWITSITVLKKVEKMLLW